MCSAVTGLNVPGPTCRVIAATPMDLSVNRASGPFGVTGHRVSVPDARIMHVQRDAAGPRGIAPDAQRIADETGLPKSQFPDSCPYTGAEILDEDWWPS